MKSTILNLIAVATLLFGWTAQAANEAAQTAQPATAAVTPVAVAPATAQKTLPRQMHSKSLKRANAKQGRSHDLDLRHCLELPSNAEIAKCAGE
jgi:hypothetical protein